MEKISSFEPIVNLDSRLIILGSIPGKKSLEEQQYYAHPQNQFWKLICEIFNEEFTTDYETKLAILYRHHIALWDIIDHCERQGSLDSQIKNEQPNDLHFLLERFPNIKKIFCNGQKSFSILKKINSKNPFSIPVFVLPSSSALHTVSFQKKLEDWQQINCL